MALSTPYKSGSISSVSGTTLVGTGITFESSDVGRLIVLTSGSGQLQHRKIVTFTSATEVEVDHAWNTTAWLDTVQDVEPSAGDAFVVSYLQSDAAFTGESQVTDSGEQVRIYAVELTGGAYVHFTNKQVDLRSSNVEIGSGAGMIFGWYKYIAGEDAQVTDSCHIIDDSPNNGGNQMGRGTNPGGDFGMLDIYGGTILVDKGAVFWRLYHDGNPSTVQVRIINVQCFGAYGLGSRADGFRSIIIVSVVGANNNTGACNTRTAVSRVSITAIDSLQAGYVWLSVANGGPVGRLIFPRLNELDRAIRSNNSEHTGTNIMEVIAKKSELDQIPIFIFGEGGVNPESTHTYRYGNLLKPKYVDDSNAVVTDTVKTVVIDATDTIVDTEDVTTGERSEIFIRHSDLVTQTGNMVLENGDGTLPSYVTRYAPYRLNSFLFGKQINNAIVTAEEFYGATQTLLNDLVLTETDKAKVDEYEEIDTPEKFYDRACSYLYDNYAGEATTLVSRIGNEIDLGAYDLVISPSISTAFSFDGTTITIKANTFVGNLKTTGLISLDGTAGVAGRYEDRNGVVQMLPWTVSNIQAGSTIQIYNETKVREVVNKVVTGTGLVTENGSFNADVIDTNDYIRLRITCTAGSTAFLPFEAFAVATSAGFGFIADQQPDTIYNLNNIDGSAVSTLSADYPNVQIDISDGDGFADTRELYAFAVYQATTPEGIDKWFNAITAVDEMNYRINVSAADIKLQNKGNGPLVITGARLYRSDGTSVLFAELGDQPMVQDTGELLQYIEAQVKSSLDNNTRLSSIDGNTKLIPGLF